MPTSSQSQILSVVDHQLLQKQHVENDDGQPKSLSRAPANQSKRHHQNDDRNQSPSPPPANITERRRSSGKLSDTLPAARPSQRQDVLHIPVININDMTRDANRTTRATAGQERVKPAYLDSSRESLTQRRNSFNSDQDEQTEIQYKYKSIRKYPINVSAGEENPSSTSDLENTRVDDDERQSSVLDENTRRLLVLGTIRPSKTFYRNLPESDVNHLMDYFRRMKNTNQRVTSEQLNEELANKYVEYKPKIFFDSATVTKTQVHQVERIIEPYAEQIRSQEMELARLENPIRFVIKATKTDQPIVTIPREYHDCLITLVTQSDPLRKSKLVTDLVQEKLLEEVKANSLDISYFPGGVNYDVPREEVDESGQMSLETYQKLKKRLNGRKVWYFSGPPEKKPNALLAVLPSDSPVRIDHQRLVEALYERIRSFATDDDPPVDQRILSIEFLPLTCILNSNDVSNQFIIDCDTNKIKQQLMETPLKVGVGKQSILMELISHDENMQREYDKFIKSEKYRELIKNHDEAKKRFVSSKK